MAMARRPPLSIASAYICCLLSPANLDADALVLLQVPSIFVSPPRQAFLTSFL